MFSTILEATNCIYTQISIILYVIIVLVTILIIYEIILILYIMMYHNVSLETDIFLLLQESEYEIFLLYLILYIATNTNIFLHIMIFSI